MRITIIDGHPDPSKERFCHALASAYADGATQAGHDVVIICGHSSDLRKRRILAARRMIAMAAIANPLMQVRRAGRLRL